MLMKVECLDVTLFMDSHNLFRVASRQNGKKIMWHQVSVFIQGVQYKMGYMGTWKPLVKWGKSCLFLCPIV